MEFRDKIKRLRKKAFLTQKEMGEKIGVTGLTVSSYELGRTLPILRTGRNIVQFAKSHGVKLTMDEIYG